MKYGRFFFATLGCVFVGGMIAAAVLQARGIPELVRIHVIANSDSPEDQAVKLKVRDAILELMDAQEMTADDAAAYLDKLREQMPQITAVARQTLQDAGVDQDVRVQVGTFRFPTRQYAGGALPAGRYMALRVELGEAAGKNWWCVMYPPMCVVGHPTLEEPISDENDLQICSWLWERIRQLWKGGIT